MVHGRLGALIEIGAGFHPELTGRENICPQRRHPRHVTHRRFSAKFDRIVAFAEVERFIDTPIKHYSSGMQMRLGFAVAAHTDPDVLLIDEILGRRGCVRSRPSALNKLAELKEQDKTIILCSHNLSNITDHAKRCSGWIGGRGAHDRRDGRGPGRLPGTRDGSRDMPRRRTASTKHEASGGRAARSRFTDVVTAERRAEQPQNAV